jgi:hypothetical protein
MVGKTLDVEHLLDPDTVASDISNKYQEWHSFKNGWITEKKELRNYLFATDTRTTTNNKNAWFNSTTTPKITQIYDNLKANYTAALFPNRNWMRWEADDRAGAHKAKRDVIQSYMENKIRQSGFRVTADKLIDDWVQYGNAFATVTFESNSTELPNGEVVSGYVGPKLQRISPFDVSFNPVASSFTASPKIIRSLISMGEAKLMIDKGRTEYGEIFNRMQSNRATVGGTTQTDKSDGFIADGFSDIQHYYGSDYVEILTFYGDIYDKDTGTVRTNRKIEIVDRAYVISDEPIASWLGQAPIFHIGWRDRPDNLYSMGPLDNLVGMQYRIDHLENLKADVFDQIAFPILKIVGDVEDFDYEPGERIYIGEEGDVAPMVPDTTALNADFQIQTLEMKMEEMAGAPRQAMGIRTPGEKTAFEVQTLENSASRIFQHKAEKFSSDFLEPILNAMLESARRNMNFSDTIRVLDDETGALLFKEITKEDITAKGRIVPLGARHFAERALRVQNLNQLMQIKLMDPTVGVHLSGKEIARLISVELGEDKIFKENVSVEEQTETQEVANDAEAGAMERLQQSAEQGL